MTEKLAPQPTPRARMSAGRLLAPVLASVAVHALLLTAVAGVTLTVLTVGPSETDEPIAVLRDQSTRESLPQPNTADRATLTGNAGDNTLVTSTLKTPPDIEVAGTSNPLADIPTTNSGPTLTAASDLETLNAAPAGDRIANAPSRVRVAGIGGRRAKDVVFIVDTSGGTLGALNLVIDELERTLASLKPTQRFAVLSFSDTRSIDREDSPIVRAAFEGLRDASEIAKADAIAWLRDQRPRGRSTPLPALEAALELDPEAAFLLTRSIERTERGQWGEGLDAILKRLDELNPRSAATGFRTTTIFTIQLLEPDPTGILESIAIAHGGGTDAHAVRTSRDLARPAASVSLDNELDIAAALLDGLAREAADLIVLHGYPDAQTIRKVRTDAAAALSRIDPNAIEDDPYAAWIAARALVLRIAADPSQSDLIDNATRLLESAQRETGIEQAATLESARLAVLRDAPISDRIIESLASFSTLDAALVRLAMLDPGTRVNEASAVIADTPNAAGLVADWLTRLAIRENDIPRAVAAQSLATTNMRELIARITRVADDEWSYADLPDHAALARVVATRNEEEAEQLLRLVAGRAEPASEAWTLASVDLARRLQSSPETRHEAARALLGLASAHAPDSRATQWALASLAITWELAGALEALSLEEASGLRDKIDQGLLYGEHEDPAMDAWLSRRELVTLRIAQASELAAALDELSRFGPDHRLTPAAVVVVRGKLSPSDVKTLRSAAAWFDDRSPVDAWRVRLELAMRLGETSPREASEIAESLIELGAPTEAEADSLAVLAGQLRLEAGDKQGAFSLVRSLLRDPTASDDPAWRAWAIALDVIAASEEPGSLDAARAHAARLERIDPTLGPPDAAARIRAVLTRE